MEKPMTPEEFAKAMRKLANGDDTEDSHFEADQIMCDILRALGYGEGVKVFREMKRWYA